MKEIKKKIPVFSIDLGEKEKEYIEQSKRYYES